MESVYQSPLRLEVLEQFESNHTVLRCNVQSPGGSGLPPTVIIKQRNFNQALKPNDFDQGLLFRNELASLDFLTSLSRSSSLGPHLLASDRNIGLVVLEDLGIVQTVQEVLYSEDHQAAVEVLVGMGQTLGQLQRITHGREKEFETLQNAHEAATPECDASLDIRGRLDDLRDNLASLDIAFSDEFESAIHALESAIHGPGIFRSFIHHDAGPHNFVATASGVRLLDFEFGGYGHELVDVVCARLAFPPAFRGRILPPEVVRKLEEAYLVELAQYAPGTISDEVFAEATAQACAHWAFSKLIGFWSGYLRERLKEGETRDTRGGRAPERSAFLRRQVFTYLRLALASLEELEQLPELRLTLSQIVERLLEIWPGTPLLPGYPAFGGEPWHYP